MMFTDGKGLTLANANSMCRKATDRKTEAEKFIEEISFVNEFVSLISGENEKQIRVGTTNLNKIKDSLTVIAEMNGFIAYFAEARKALEEYQNACTSISLLDWCKQEDIKYPEHPVRMNWKQWLENKGMEVPEKPKRPAKEKKTTIEEVMSEMSIADAVTYYATKSAMAAIGKAINDKMPISNARKLVHEKLIQPYNIDGKGRDALVYSYTSSVDVEIIDALFLELQNKYRQLERKLNKMDSDFKKLLAIRNAEEANLANKATDDYNKSLAEFNYKVDRYENEANKEYERELDEYNSEIDKINEKYLQFIRDEQARCSKLKLVVPNKFEQLVHEWSQDMNDV